MESLHTSSTERQATAPCCCFLSEHACAITVIVISALLITGAGLTLAEVSIFKRCAHIKYPIGIGIFVTTNVACIGLVVALLGRKRDSSSLDIDHFDPPTTSSPFKPAHFTLDLKPVSEPRWKTVIFVDDTLRYHVQIPLHNEAVFAEGGIELPYLFPHPQSQRFYCYCSPIGDVENGWVEIEEGDVIHSGPLGALARKALAYYTEHSLESYYTSNTVELRTPVKRTSHNASISGSDFAPVAYQPAPNSVSQLPSSQDSLRISPPFTHENTEWVTIIHCDGSRMRKVALPIENNDSSLLSLSTSDLVLTVKEMPHGNYQLNTSSPRSLENGGCSIEDFEIIWQKLQFIEHGAFVGAYKMYNDLPEGHSPLGFGEPFTHEGKDWITVTCYIGDTPQKIAIPAQESTNTSVPAQMYAYNTQALSPKKPPPAQKRLRFGDEKNLDLTPNILDDWVTVNKNLKWQPLPSIFTSPNRPKK